MRFLVDVVQCYKRFATVEVEAEHDLEASDQVDAMDEDALPWGDLASDDPEILGFRKAEAPKRGREAEVRVAEMSTEPGRPRMWVVKVYVRDRCFATTADRLLTPEKGREIWRKHRRRFAPYDESRGVFLVKEKSRP